MKAKPVWTDDLPKTPPGVGCLLACLVVGLVSLMLALTVYYTVHAQPEPPDWDRSSLAAGGQCRPGGILHVTVTNNGSDMAGPVDWRFTVHGLIMSSGTLQLLAGASITLDSPPAPGQRIEFSVDQRPGHPGTGIVYARLACSPTAVRLSGMRAGPVLPLWLEWLLTQWTR